MPTLGITGGLATGKTYVTRWLADRGAIVFSADEAARAILGRGGATLQAIVSAFGAAMLTPEGDLDRARLGQRIFADPDARAVLNRITHPPIRRLLRAQIEAARDDFPHAVVAVEIPLLFESNSQAYVEHIVVVSASETTQIKRLRARNGLDEAQARQRIAAQWPLRDKIARADTVLDNDGPPEVLAAALEALWRRMAAPARSNESSEI